jgi:hypothetical protein
MTDISRHPLLKQAFEVCQAIEQCGASMQLTHAVGKASALLGAIDKNLRDETGIVAVTSIQGEAASFALDPLEQAVESTARVMRDELEHMAQMGMTLAGDFHPTPTYRRMADHLNKLLEAQLKRVSVDEAL